MIEVGVRCCCGSDVAHFVDQEAANEAEDGDGEESSDAECSRIERRTRVVGRAFLLIVSEHHVRRLGVGGKRICVAVLAQIGEECLGQCIHAPAVGDARVHFAAAEVAFADICMEHITARSGRSATEIRCVGFVLTLSYLMMYLMA